MRPDVFGSEERKKTDIGESYFAIVEKKTGQVKKMSFNTKIWELVEKGDILKEGDAIRTMDKSSAVIRFHNDRRFNIPENSLVVLTIENIKINGLKHRNLYRHIYRGVVDVTKIKTYCEFLIPLQKLKKIKQIKNLKWEKVNEGEKINNWTMIKTEQDSEAIILYKKTNKEKKELKIPPGQVFLYIGSDDILSSEIRQDLFEEYFEEFFGKRKTEEALIKKIKGNVLFVEKKKR
ncbi:MAG: hypothetical protein AB1349_13820 [Elusimicrobiota bacterium]